MRMTRIIDWLTMERYSQSVPIRGSTGLALRVLMVRVSRQIDSQSRTDGHQPVRATSVRLASRFGLLAGAALFLAACQTAGLNQATGTLAASQAVNIASLTEVISSNPQDPGAYNMRGTAYGREGRHNDALADFNQALALNPSFYQALANRALVHRELGNDAQALATIRLPLRLTRPMTRPMSGAATFIAKPDATPRLLRIMSARSCSTPPMRAPITIAP
jgi:hypothetical protein